MKDLRDWYRYLEVIARDPAVDSLATPPSRTRAPAAVGVTERAPAPAAAEQAVPLTRSGRRLRPAPKQEVLPMALGATAGTRRKGGRRPLTESRDEIIRRLMDPVLTLHEAAAILDLSKATVRRYTEHGKLACQRTAGGQRRFRLSDVIALLETSPGTLRRGR